MVPLTSFGSFVQVQFAPGGPGLPFGPRAPGLPRLPYDKIRNIFQNQYWYGTGIFDLRVFGPLRFEISRDENFSLYVYTPFIFNREKCGERETNE